MGLKAQNQKVTIKGIVISKQTSKPIKDVDVYVKNLKIGTSTLSDGSFTLNLPLGKYTIFLSNVGSKTIKYNIDLKHKIENLHFIMEEYTKELDEVSIKTKSRKKIEQIVKFATTLQNIPITVSVIDNKLLTQTNTDNINDALRYTTGIKPTVNYGGFQTFKMRGFGSPIYMIDGNIDERMNLSNSAPLTSLAAVERIEYLKGPASVLYGHSAVGGILNIVRKQPSKQFHANFYSSYGSWNTNKMIVGAGGKINVKNTISL